MTHNYANFIINWIEIVWKRYSGIDAIDDWIQIQIRNSRFADCSMTIRRYIYSFNSFSKQMCRKIYFAINNAYVIILKLKLEWVRLNYISCNRVIHKNCIVHISRVGENWWIELHISVFVSFCMLVYSIIYCCTYMNMSQFAFWSDPKNLFFFVDLSSHTYTLTSTHINIMHMHTNTKRQNPFAITKTNHMGESIATEKW